VATYSGTIDLRVTGNAEQKAELIKKRINEIKDIANTLKPVPNLFDKRGNDAIVKAKEELKKLVGQYGKGTGSGNRFSNTIAGLNRQLGGFNRILSNVNIKSDEFTQALAASEKVSRRLARAEAERLRVQTQINTANTVGRATSVQETLDLGKIIPKSVAGLEFYQRELEDTLRSVRIGSQDYRELARAIADVNRQLAVAQGQGPVQGPALPPGFNESGRISRPSRRGSRFQDIATGAGFPLLFGGGPLQALAGGVGGALGGLGGSIAGSAIASQVEAFARAAAETGVALTSTSGALELVREKSLFSKEENRELAAQLEEQGDAAGLAKLLTEELSLAIGNNGVKALQDLGNTTKETTRLWNLLTTQLFKLIAGPLNQFLKIVNQVLGGITTRGRFEGLSQDLSGNEAFQAAVREKRKARGRGAQLGSLQREDQLDLLARAQAGEFGALPRTAAIPVTPEDQRSFASRTTGAERLGKRTRQQNAAAADRLALSEAELRIAKETSELSKIDLEFDLKRTKVQQEYAKLISKALSDQERRRLGKAQELDLELLSVQRNEKISEHMRDQFQSAMQLNDELLQVVPNVTELSDEFKSLANTINNEIINGIEGMIDGTKTLGQVASSMLKQIANQLLQTAIMGPSGSGGIGGMLLSGISSIFGGGGGGGFKSPSVLTSGLDFSGAFAGGGRPPVGKAALVGERGPELFVPRSSGTIVPNNAIGGSTNVVVNVDASGTEVQGNQGNADQLGRLIGQAVQAELIKQKRPGGLLTR
jgi:hypothetical protein